MQLGERTLCRDRSSADDRYLCDSTSSCAWMHYWTNARPGCYEARRWGKLVGSRRSAAVPAGELQLASDAPQLTARRESTRLRVSRRAYMLAVGVETVELRAGVVTAVHSSLLLSPDQTSMPLALAANAGDRPPLLPPKVLAPRWAHVVFSSSITAPATICLTNRVPLSVCQQLVREPL